MKSWEDRDGGSLGRVDRFCQGWTGWMDAHFLEEWQSGQQFSQTDELINELFDK